MTIPTLPTPPNRSQDQATFDTNIAAWIASLDAWTTAVNAMGITTITGAIVNTPISGSTGAFTTLSASTTSGNAYATVSRATQAQGQVGIQISGGTSGTDWLIYQPTSSNILTFFGESANRMELSSTGLVVTGTISGTSTILSSGATGGIGYATGAGGTVSQGAGAGKATGVTLAKVCGTITLDGASLAGDTTVTFLLTMTGFTLNSTDQLILSHQSVGTFGAYTLNARYASSTTMNIDIHNNTPGALAEAIVIQYSLIRSVAA